MLSRALKYQNGAISTRVQKFGLAVNASPPFLARANQLLFLCGANRSQGVPSARREKIKSFIEGLSKDFRVIYAEGVFNELSKYGHNKNVLDLEHEISDIADKILIVLESPSAFCELGAFAHKRIRKKLVIINNSAFRSEKSFINTGPIAAAEEVKAPVIWYPMKSDGIHEVDGIGATFFELTAAISESYGASSNPGSTQSTAPSPSQSQSQREIRVKSIASLASNKTSLYFIHDLVLFAGPISYSELIDLLKVAFGNNSYDVVKQLLGILRSAELIRSHEVRGTWVYMSTLAKPFMRYAANVDSLMATFRRFHLKTDPERFAHA